MHRPLPARHQHTSGSGALRAAAHVDVAGARVLLEASDLWCGRRDRRTSHRVESEEDRRQCMPVHTTRSMSS